jgi:hypothetical protein
MTATMTRGAADERGWTPMTTRDDGRRETRSDEGTKDHEESHRWTQMDTDEGMAATAVGRIKQRGTFAGCADFQWFLMGVVGWGF